MLRRSSWLGFALLLSGCGQGFVPTESKEHEQVEPARAPVVAAPALAARAADGEDCECHAKRGSAARAETVDVSALETARAPSRGRADAPVTLLVFCDFECPYCRRAQKTLAELEQKYGDDLRVVFKQLPLPFHENARLYAKASLAAHDQGKFWELHDKLLGSEKLGPGDLERVAASVGIELGRFRAALASDELERRVDREREDAERVGARGTPTFVINGKKIVGAQPLETFVKQIDEELGVE